MFKSRFQKSMLLLSLLFPLLLVAQDVNSLLKEAKQLEAAFRDNEALVKYTEVLKLDPSNLVALCKISELYSLLGKRQAKKEDQKTYFKAARSFGQQALKANANSAEANFVMALAMGRMAIISSGEEKINAVKDIRTYADRCVQLDPQNFKGYHILGRWHYEVANLSSVEKWLVKVTYGSLPPASMQDAINYYEKSRQINPSLLVNYLELAKIYHKKDDNTRAMEMLNTLLKLPNVIYDDPTVKIEAKKLLKKWQD
jgi:tetratricopeptide (TPR) repeat protein